MQLTLQKLLPLPLRDKITHNSSDIWLQDLSLPKGEYISIQAPSGTGKTTLIHMLYGLRNDYEGTITWDHKALNQIHVEELSKMRATYVSIIFQDLRLMPELTAWENLELKRSLTNTISPELMEHMMERLGIPDKKNSLTKTLSYGEQQRVAIIRSLLQPFDWLLMDEPFSHLDHLNIEKATALIAEIAQRNHAGILLADLEKNDYFRYHKRMFL
jgi:ABC-type lipoprotein export system ATPase subunit